MNDALDAYIQRREREEEEDYREWQESQRKPTPPTIEDRITNIETAIAELVEMVELLLAVTPIQHDTNSLFHQYLEERRRADGLAPTKGTE